MLKKFKNWCAEPLTKGGYMKLCFVSVVLAFAEFIYFFWGYGLGDAVKGFFRKINPFRRKGYDTEEES